tara:strand:- start:1326 stop:1883 length:558 start_codon:yes stop_codon:yes gene_type:complete
MKLLITIFLLLLPLTVISQSYELQNIENLILEENYDLADSILKYKILNKKNVSSDLTFLFGKNSFFLEKYDQSINWLNKYLELEGDVGEFSDESIKFLELSNTRNIIQNNNNIENIFIELYSYNYIQCENDRKVCPICKGSSVIILDTDVSKIYKTCPFSDNNGFLTCDEYNLFLRGKLNPKTSN